MRIIYNFAFLLLFLQFAIACNQASGSAESSVKSKKSDKSSTPLLVFRSGDGGQTWQDISKGLPENLRTDTIGANNFFSNDNGLYLTVGTEVYHSTPNATAPVWTKEIYPCEHSSITPGKSATFYWGGNMKTTNGTSVWSPIFEIYQRPGIRTSFETAGGAIFIGTDRGFFKTVNNGNTWKQVRSGELVGHLAELGNVLVAISNGRIIRSTDNGESWTKVTSEDGLAFDVKSMKGGFVALTATSESGTRRLSTSYDGGKNWQPIGSSLQDKAFSDSIRKTWNNRADLKVSQTSIIQFGEKFLCMHPDGIFRSTDKGKTWNLLLPSVKDKSFSLFVSGNVIYAIAGKRGC